MYVEARVVGKPQELEDRVVAVPAGTSTLRELIATLVRDELASFSQRQREKSLLRVLTPADLVRGHDSGKFAAEPQAAQEAPAFDTAYDRALEAFTDGLYFVFVDDEQLESLDAPVTVRESSRMRLVRLVALAGG